MTGNADKSIGTKTKESGRSAAAISRRAMLKGSAAAMPAILTLQSGAAHARSSNLLSLSQTPYRDDRGRLLCLDVNSVNMVDSGGRVADLGTYPSARVTVINERDYRVLPSMDAAQISEEDACREGRTVYYLERSDSRTATWQSGFDGDSAENLQQYGEWLQGRVPRSAFVSATALSSFAGNYVVNEI